MNVVHFGLCQRLQGFAAGAGGSDAIFRMLELLEVEISTCMRLLGINSFNELDNTFLTNDNSFGNLDVLSSFPLLSEGY